MSPNAQYEIADLHSGRKYRLDSDGKLLFGRSPEAHVQLLDVGLSRRQFELFSDSTGLHIEVLSAKVPTYCDQQPVLGSRQLPDDSVLSTGSMRWRVSKREATPERDATIGNSGADCPSNQTLFGGAAALASHAALPGEFVLPETTLIGRGDDADLRLKHIQVSRQHARIRMVGDRAILQDLGSTNGTYVDGQRVVIPEMLRRGARIGVGPYSLTFTGRSLTSSSRINNLQLEAQSLSKRVSRSDHPGDTQLILREVSLVVRPHEFVCILGPSGSGKSTLLSALSARSPADEGRVMINQADLYDNFESMKREIAVVPQRDNLHESLTPAESLRFTARLRLPRDSSPQEIDAQVDRTLQAVGLQGKSDTPIDKLSGGQRRRVRLANELISNPSLLFLDEVTSGLDERTDLEMMGVFRSLADAGKTVVCVTHSLANIEETCHLVVFLTTGGRLAFIGSPGEAIDYFQVKHLGEIYRLLEDESRAEHWQSKFRGSRLYEKYVSTRMSASPAVARPRTTAGIQALCNDGLKQFAAQWPVLIQRYGRVYFSDRGALMGVALQCITVACVVCLVFWGEIAAAGNAFREAALSCHVLFVLAVSSFWFGCNNAAKEIVKEAAIYREELQVNLDLASYYASKFFLQFAVSALQALLLSLAVTWLCQVPCHVFASLPILLVAAASGVATGLFLSAIASSEEVAATLVPLVLIPQIILSDVFVELHGVASLLGRVFATNYWIYGALRAALPARLAEQLNGPIPMPHAPLLGLSAVALQIGLLAALSVTWLHFRDRRHWQFPTG